MLKDPSFNSFPPGQNGHHFADDIFRCIFVDEKLCILIKICDTKESISIQIVLMKDMVMILAQFWHNVTLWDYGSVLAHHGIFIGGVSKDPSFRIHTNHGIDR